MADQEKEKTDRSAVDIAKWSTISAIGVAMIALIGTVITNWDKIAHSKLSPTSTSTAVSATLSLPEIYEYKQKGGKGSFVYRSGKTWQEENAFGEVFNIFKEIERDSEFITIHDESRKMKIKIPIEGGYTLLTWKEKDWVDVQFYFVTKKPNT